MAAMNEVHTPNVYETLFADYGFEKVPEDMDMINIILTQDLEADDRKALKDICTTVASNKNMMRIILRALIEGVEYGNLMMRLENLTKVDKWIELTDKVYLWPMYSFAPDLVSWDRVFAMDDTKVFYDAVKCMNIEGVVGHIDRKIALLKFFQNYDFGSAFKESNNEVDSMITNLNAQKNCLKFFTGCMSAWQPGYKEYFVASPPGVLQDPEAKGATLWNAEPIASQRQSYKRPAPGDSVMVSKEEFEDRFYNKIACGMLTTSPNPELAKLGEKFPFESVIFSGSIIQQALDPYFDEQKTSDLDIFVIGFKAPEREAAFKRIVEWFTCQDMVYYGIKGGVVCIYIKDIPRQFQIINTNHANGIDIINRFDLSHIQWFAKNTTMATYAKRITAASIVGYAADHYKYEGLHVFGSFRAFEAQRTRVTQITNNAKVTTPRLIKGLIRGFSIETNQQIKDNVIDITSLVERPTGSDIRGHIRNYSANYFPRSIDSERFDGNKQDETNYILRMIGLETQAQEVTADPLVVMNKTTLNINFEVEYDSLGFARFNSDTVINNGRARGKTEFTLRNKNGNIYMIGGQCQIIDVSNEEGNIDIRMKILDHEFIDFIKNILEGNVLRRFTQKALTKNLLLGADSDTLEMRFDKFKYERRLKAAVKDTCARTNRGAQISLEEDLNPGDHISPMFQIVYNINENPQNQRGGADDGEQKGISVRLVPIKIIKIENDDAGSDDENDETVMLNKQEMDVSDAAGGAIVTTPSTVSESTYSELSFD